MDGTTVVCPCNQELYGAARIQMRGEWPVKSNWEGWSFSGSVRGNAPFEEEQGVHLTEVGDALVTDPHHLHCILQR